MARLYPSEPYSVAPLLEAHSIIERAEREATRTERAVRERAAARLRRARSRAKEWRAARAAATTMRERKLNEVVIHNERARLLTTLESSAIHLALDVVTTIMGKEHTATSNAIRGLLREGFSRLAGRSSVRVLVHPDELAATREALAELGVSQIEATPSPTIRLGSIRIENSEGALELSWLEAVAELRARLTSTVTRGLNDTVK